MVATNSIDLTTTGVVGYTGTAFTASPTTQFNVQIGGATSSTLANVANGTAGQVLTSNGAAAPTWQTSPINVVTVILTSAQIKALNATPIQMVAAPGAGKVLTILAPIYAEFLYGGSNVFVAAAAQSIRIYWGTGTGTPAAQVVNNTVLTGSQSQYTIQNVTTSTGLVTPFFENLPINLWNDTATEISGNAANNNTIGVTLVYTTTTLH